ncbi:DUF4203 domain-containing protein [bacterium]|nr:DUF4203 domain-containing protein [bacterium]
MPGQVILSQIAWWPDVVLGVLLCVAGWTLYWVGLSIAGAVIGGILGVAAGWLILTFTKIEPTQAYWILALGLVLGGILGVFLIRKLHRLFFFVLGACIGLALGWNGADALMNWNWLGSDLDPVYWRIIFGVLGAALGGFLMVIGSRVVVIAITALAGSILVALAVPDPLALLLVIPLALGSFVFQLGLLRRFATPEERGAAEEHPENR